jgi:hypothetical protein
MNADLYYWYKRVILYHNTFESEIGDYNQSSSADFFRSHLMSEKVAKSYTGLNSQEFPRMARPIEKACIHLPL